MAEEIEAEPGDEKKKGSKKGFIIGLLGAIILGGGAFYATSSGMILGPKSETESHEVAEHDPLPDLVFIPLDPMVISLGSSASAKFLRFTAQLDVEPASAEEVALVMPRILDVLNTYLRAVSEEELGKPSSLERLRAQMLRRVQVVTGPGQVRDLLITEFVLG